MTPELITSMKPEIVIGQMFQSRDMMHIAHIQTTSFSQHHALQEYYEGALKLTDEIIEVYFGCLGKRLNFKIPGSDYMSPDTHLKQFKEYIKKHRVVFGMDRTDVQNLIDELIALINKTLYLLTLS